MQKTVTTVFQIVDARQSPVDRRYLDQLIEFGRHFYNEAEFYKKGLLFEDQSLEATLNFLIGNEMSILLFVVDQYDKVVGSIAGVCAPWILFNKQIVCQELWFWLEPEYRSGRLGNWLLKAFESKAKQLGATHLIMGTFDNPREKVLIRYYKLKGYQKLETHVIKRL